MKKTHYIVVVLVSIVLNSCGAYNFTGAKPIEAKTFQVNYFANNADLIQPGIERTFTLKLQDLIQNQTNLNLTNTGGELLFEGEITEYRITPMTATADQTAAQNRLTISINVRYTNRNKEEDDFEKRFSFYDDFNGNTQLTGSQLTKSLDVIFDRITQDIFNEALAKW
ncbi:LptE family protein [uncultured Flavobacterium sp.]|uniref:LptE family protein n=1 Tax=uncultured Flavobacterium sp. TaxID=165435 RepID=UPI0030EF4714|tara:strand:+ start:2318 stop:2821 length:504 start_codon:yes stop_codon:yes gene_type:complete